MPIVVVPLPSQSPTTGMSPCWPYTNGGKSGAPELLLLRRFHCSTFGPPASSQGYELTERGRELEPVLVALARWGSRVPVGTAAELSTDALMLALQTTFDPRAAGALRARLELRIGDDCLRAEIGSGRFAVSRGSAGRADAILTTGAATLRALVFGDRTIADAVGRGDLRIDGDRGVAAHFIGCFPRPAAVSSRPDL